MGSVCTELPWVSVQHNKYLGGKMPDLVSENPVFEVLLWTLIASKGG